MKSVPIQSFFKESYQTVAFNNQKNNFALELLNNRIQKRLNSNY